MRSNPDLQFDSLVISGFPVIVGILKDQRDDVEMVLYLCFFRMDFVSRLGCAYFCLSLRHSAPSCPHLVENVAMFIEAMFVYLGIIQSLLLILLVDVTVCCNSSTYSFTVCPG